MAWIVVVVVVEVVIEAYHQHVVCLHLTNSVMGLVDGGGLRVLYDLWAGLNRMTSVVMHT